MRWLIALVLLTSACSPDADDAQPDDFASRWCQTHARCCAKADLQFCHRTNARITVQDPEKCIACGLCKKNCPVGAVSGEKKQAHVIDTVKCTKCDTCYQVCPAKAGAVTKLSGKEELARMTAAPAKAAS